MCHSYLSSLRTLHHGIRRTENFSDQDYVNRYITWEERITCSVGNHDAAENAAMMYSLIGSCKANDVDTREWMTDVLTRIPEYNNDYTKDLADLLPHNWKASKKLQETSNMIQE